MEGAFHKILFDRQSEIINQIQDRFGLVASQKEAIGELSSYDNHPADLGTETYERGKDLALSEHAERELEEINAALHAMEEGTYGICKVCSMDIPYDRLLALPTAIRVSTIRRNNKLLHDSARWKRKCTVQILIRMK